MPYGTSLPAAGVLTTSLTPLFTNPSGVSVTVGMVKLTNNSCSDRIVNLYLDCDGQRTPLLPERFQLKAGNMSEDDLTLQVRRDQRIEGYCDAEDAVSYVIS